MAPRAFPSTRVITYVGVIWTMFNVVSKLLDIGFENSCVLNRVNNGIVRLTP